MKEKILQQLRAAVTDKNGKTSISEQTLNAYADLAGAQITDESQLADGIKPFVAALVEIQKNINHVAATAVTEKEAKLKSDYEKKIKELEGKTPPPPENGDEARLLALTI